MWFWTRQLGKKCDYTIVITCFASKLEYFPFSNNLENGKYSSFVATLILPIGDMADIVYVKY